MAKQRRYAREAWDRACLFVKEDDGLDVFRTRGMWTAQKLFFLCAYLEQVARGMKSNRAFPDGLRYVDLFCGSGVSVVEDEYGVEQRFPGSAILAASLGESAFRSLHLSDENEAALNAVIARIRRSGYSGQIVSRCGDANQIVDSVVADLPGRALNVAFIDPCSLDVHYETIRRLAVGRSMDLVILFSDRIDLQRNVKDIYYPRVNDKLDLFLGHTSNWRVQYDKLQERGGSALRQMFAEIYCEQLAKLNYGHSRTWPLNGPQGPMFRLVFASKHPLGLKYCDIASTEDFYGQRGLYD